MNDEDEIERRFLIDKRELLIEVDIYNLNRFAINQCYLSESPVVRVRTQESLDKVYMDYGYLTVKGPGLLKRKEYEYEIPLNEAKDMFDLAKSQIQKIRFQYPLGDVCWEIDYFIIAKIPDLWMAEIELSSEDEDFVKPKWLREEVTFNSEYSNVNLAVAK